LTHNVMILVIVQVFYRAASSPFFVPFLRPLSSSPFFVRRFFVARNRREAGEFTDAIAFLT
ncbi:MAG: hypothetical protein WD738_13980, partial [Pirellulales bacterium]